MTNGAFPSSAGSNGMKISRQPLPETAAGTVPDLFPVAPFQIQTDAAGKSLRIHPQPESDGVPIQKRFVNLVLIGVAFAVVLQEIEFKASAPAVVAGRVLRTAERAPVTLRVPDWSRGRHPSSRS